MELINPTLTVQNTASEYWIVRMQHTFADSEFIDVQLAVRRREASVSQLQVDLIRLAIERLQAILSVT